MKFPKMELTADVCEALEKMREWRPFYEAVLKQTGDREQARKALVYILRIEKEMEDGRG